MNRITEPLRLAVGSHTAGSGKGCAMNVVSLPNGDSTITDHPALRGSLPRQGRAAGQRHLLHAPDQRPVVP